MHCHKINTDTKSKETEIKRVKDVERSGRKFKRKKKKQVRREGQKEGKGGER